MMSLSDKSESETKQKNSADTSGLQGEVLLIQPVSFSAITLALVLFIVLFVVLISMGTYHRKETVSGYLVPSKGIEKVVTSMVGVIENTLIIEGSQVNKGDVLVEISTQQDTLADVSVNQQIIQKLKSSKTEISNRIKNESSVLKGEIQRLDSAIKNSQQQLNQLTEQIQIQNNQLVMAEQEWQKFEKLSFDGFVTESDLRVKKDALLRAESNINQTARNKLVVEAAVSGMRNQLEKLPLLHLNQVQELTERYTSIEERIIQLEGNDSYSIKANIDGLVTSVQTYPGQRVSNNTYLLSIVPAENLFYAELFLPSRAIGFIQPGQQVRIRYDAFPYQQFGQYSGLVLDVAKAPINPSDLERTLPTRDPVYRVKVELDSQHVSAFGKRMDLQAGMAVSADIMLEERTLLDWLLAPFYAIKGRI